MSRGLLLIAIFPIETEIVAAEYNHNVLFKFDKEDV